MSIKLALLKSGETIISDIKELVSDDKVCGYLFGNPHKIEIANGIFLTEEPVESNEISISLSPWIVFTSEKEIAVRPDWIVSVVDPIKTIKKMYEEKINGKEYQVPTIEE